MLAKKTKTPTAILHHLNNFYKTFLIDSFPPVFYCHISKNQTSTILLRVLSGLNPLPPSKVSVGRDAFTLGFGTQNPFNYFACSTYILRVLRLQSGENPDGFQTKSFDVRFQAKISVRFRKTFLFCLRKPPSIKYRFIFSLWVTLKPIMLAVTF